MKKPSLRKYGYEEIFINNTQLKKLYNLYLDKSVYNKVLDKLVFLAIVTISVTFTLPLFIDVDPKVLLFVKSMTIFILAIFGLELLREYVKSKDAADFFRKNWVDFILVVFLSFCFFFIAFFSFLLEPIRYYASEGKNFRALFKLFKKN